MSNIKRIIYIILGTIFLVLGAVGVVLPLLPTTPFWLLTCWFYIRSSEKLYNKAMANPYFGAYVKSFLVDKSIPLRIKFISIGMLWTTIAISAFLLIEKEWVKILLLFICIGVTWHILSYPTKKMDKQDN